MNTGVCRLVDTHAHLDEIEDLDEVLEEARRVGLIAVVAVGQGYESNLKVLEISEKHRSFVYPALGLHPWEVGRTDACESAANLQLIEDNIQTVVAIGEIGLDYHKKVRALASKEQQKEACRTMLELAKKHDRPAIIHSRYAWKDSFDLVQEVGVKKVVFHWYTGVSSVLREILAAGYFISATPATEYHEEHRRAVKEAPMEKLLLETDSPVYYGRETRYRSCPSDVARSLGAVALLKGVEKGVIAQETTSNALRLFGLACPPANSMR
ncbi:TatD family hydrolase [Chloroflexota bacterium]